MQLQKPKPFTFFQHEEQIKHKTQRFNKFDTFSRHNFQQHPLKECSKLDNHLLSDDEVEAIAGKRIRDFCSGYKSFTSQSIRRAASSVTGTNKMRK